MAMERTANSPSEIILIKCFDGLVRAKDGSLEELSLEELKAQHPTSKFLFVTVTDAEADVMSDFAKDYAAQQLCIMISNEEGDETVAYSYPQLLALRLAEELAIRQSESYPDKRRNWRNDIDVVMQQLARLRGPLDIYEVNLHLELVIENATAAPLAARSIIGQGSTTTREADFTRDERQRRKKTRAKKWSF
jgi:hypothetical protein